MIVDALGIMPSGQRWTFLLAWWAGLEILYILGAPLRAKKNSGAKKNKKEGNEKRRKREKRKERRKGVKRKERRKREKRKERRKKKPKRG